ncbi:hypothetical protein OIU78_006777 [Salix suchowensis]|nr:hypothetical protein OIU78_006777 [Salix suchowensis]
MILLCQHAPFYNPIMILLCQTFNLFLSHQRQTLFLLFLIAPSTLQYLTITKISVSTSPATLVMNSMARAMPFRVFHLLTNSSPPCCFTGYDTVKFMSMNILDCSHYTTVINTDSLMGISPLDWVYGIKLSYSVPETGCERCSQSGGTCGYDTETEGMTCLCSSFSNYTRECAGGSLTAGDHRSSHCPLTFFNAAILLVLSSLLVI